jgi:hypothetical protein
MSPSDGIPPEVVAIAVALAALWAEQDPDAGSPTQEPEPWRLSGRRWGRPTDYRWS